MKLTGDNTERQISGQRTKNIFCHDSPKQSYHIKKGCTLYAASVLRKCSGAVQNKNVLCLGQIISRGHKTTFEGGSK